MDTFAIVRPEHLNHHGYLFGGQLLKWVDEYAWLAASRDFPDRTLVTRAMEHAEFRHRVPNGSILRFSACLHERGTTSVTYAVEVHGQEQGRFDEELVFVIKVTFVALDAEGKKTELGMKHARPE